MMKNEKEFIESKSVIIEVGYHTKLKHYCQGRNLKIGKVIQDLITVFLAFPKEIQKMIDQIKNNDDEKK